VSSTYVPSPKKKGAVLQGGREGKKRTTEEAGLFLERRCIMEVPPPQVKTSDCAFTSFLVAHLQSSRGKRGEKRTTRGNRRLKEHEGGKSREKRKTLTELQETESK